MAFTVEQRRESREGNRRAKKIPKISRAWLAKRKKCAGSLRQFCLTFLPEKFFLPFSPDHLKAIAKLERVAREGGTYALAMPRGSGKTELVKATALWSILYGYRKFVVIIGAKALHAQRIIGDMKKSLSNSDEIYAAFPEAVHHVRELKGNVHRARFQSFEDGNPTGLEWTKDSVQLARVPGSASAGAVIYTAGLTGSIRGMSATGPKGETFRPDLVLLDDPQDRESATSLAQTDERERIIRGDVLGLAGKTKAIAAVMPCTVIAENDLADRFLDREKNPQWSGERTRRVLTFPTNSGLWDRYFDLRADEMQELHTAKAARAFYLANRAEMDAGCTLAWPEAFDAQRFASAIEEAMTRRHDDPEEFAAEDQNEPIAANPAAAAALSADDLAERVTNLERRRVPRGCTRLTAFIDVGGDLIWYVVTALDERFGGSVIDCGTFPDQPRTYFYKSDPRPALGDMPEFKGQPQSAVIYGGLTAAAQRVLGGAYTQEETGAEMHVELCPVDANWGPATDLVYEFCRRSPFAARLLPSHGKYIGASGRPMSTYKQPTQRKGHGWQIYPGDRSRGRHSVVDVNYWKTFAAERLRTPAGGSGALWLFNPGQGRNQRLLADHLSSEYPVAATAQGRTVEEWKNMPGRDNDWWDCLVGSLVAGSILGIRFSASVAAGEQPFVDPPKQRVSFKALQERTRAARVGAKR